MNYVRFLAGVMLLSVASAQLSIKAAEENPAVITQVEDTAVSENTTQIVVEDTQVAPAEVDSTVVVPASQSIGEQLANMVSVEQREAFVKKMQKFGENFAEFVDTHPMFTLVTGIILAKKITGVELNGRANTLLLQAAMYDLFLAMTKVPPFAPLSRFIPACLIISSL